MPIDVRLAVMLAERDVSGKELADHVGITEANLSLLRRGKVKGVRFETLEKICDYLECQPGDLLQLELSIPHRKTREESGTRRQIQVRASCYLSPRLKIWIRKWDE